VPSVENHNKPDLSGTYASPSRNLELNDGGVRHLKLTEGSSDEYSGIHLSVIAEE
jgi:hypothetical protein